MTAFGAYVEVDPEKIPDNLVEDVFVGLNDDSHKRKSPPALTPY